MIWFEITLNAKGIHPLVKKAFAKDRIQSYGMHCLDNAFLCSPGQSGIQSIRADRSTIISSLKSFSLVQMKWLPTLFNASEGLFVEFRRFAYI